jgi:hypothetical protein
MKSGYMQDESELTVSKHIDTIGNIGKLIGKFYVPYVAMWFKIITLKS